MVSTYVYSKSIKGCSFIISERSPSCDTVWEEKRKSFEQYMNSLTEQENARRETLSAWNGKRAYDLYEPEWTCHTEKRIGPDGINVGDGPKFVCAPDLLKDLDDCLIYSIGSNSDFSFEQGMRNHGLNCEFHTFDGTLNLTSRPLPAGLDKQNIHFHNWNVDLQSGTNEKGYISKTISDIVTKLGNEGKRIDVFKIDCEGCEYGVMPQVLDLVKSGLIRIDQVQIEIHGTDAAKVQSLFQSFRAAGYAVFHKERNHWRCNGYSCAKYSFISLTRAKQIFIHSHCLLDSSGLSEFKIHKGGPHRQNACDHQKRNFISEMYDTPCAKLGYSEGNQDCMLDIIFGNLGTTNRYFVEYGFNTGQQCSASGPNTCKLWKDGWQGLLLDGSHENESINLHSHFLYEDNIQEIFQQYDVPRDFDFLSSDMDSHDFFVLSSILERYKPRVVTTEYNSNWPLEWTMSQIDPTMSETLWQMSKNSFRFRQCIWGASASALRQLMELHGYRLIGLTPMLDLFWARKELLTCFNVPQFSYFVEKMNLGKLHHERQSNLDYMDWLIDTDVWIATKNLEKARNAAKTKIASMIESGAPLPCFSDLVEAS